MAELGSIFEPEREGPRGRDVRVRVSCPAWALGDPEGVELEVPAVVEIDGERVARTRSGFDVGERIRVNLPDGFPDGGTLRLRGQGETPARGGRAGDLLVTVAIDGAARVRPDAARGAAAGSAGAIVWITLAAAAAAAIALAR